MGLITAAITKGLTVAALIGAVSSRSVPRAFGVPTDDGFPNPNAQQIMNIESKAGGLLPPGPLPTKLSAEATTAWQLIAANEVFETAFFSSLVNNITDGVEGYKLDKANADESITVASAIVAQEQLHAIAARAVLQSANAFIPDPCEYKFPVSKLEDAINLASTFTAAVLGALQGANVLNAKDGQFPLVQVLSGVIGQEGEQNGLYRFSLGRIPSESPFLTYVPAGFAWSALQGFVVPGSCPYALDRIALPVFPPLVVNGSQVAVLAAGDQVIRFSADVSGVEAAGAYVGGDGDGLYVTFTTGQGLPFSAPVGNVAWQGSVVSFDAEFAYEEHAAHGFSHAALTTKADFSSADDVQNAALAGPALLQVVNPV